jgi:hypothetical protein
MSRNLSTDGNRFFFQTPDPLVGRDANGKGGCPLTQEFNPNLTCLDVYEWEATGTGSCTEAAVDGGCIYLLSSGQSDRPSLFADADLSGKNAFIFTEQQLTPSDQDELYDAYDVSEGGGLASQHQSPAPKCASQQACQGPAASPGASSTPGSSTFVGPGNPKSKASKCHKGGKCKKHHKKKSHKRKQAKKRTAGREQGGAK